MKLKKTQIVMKLKNFSCDETEKFKLWLNSKTEIVMKHKNEIVMKPNNWNCDETQKIKLW